MPYPSQIDKEKIGQDALAIVEKQSWNKWSLRDVASKLGVTPNALYRHIDDRAGLVVAMGEAATEQLHQYIFSEFPDASAVDPDLGVVALASRFIDFAQSRPVAYAAFANAKPSPDHPKIMAWLEIWRSFNERVRAAVPEAADAAAFALWAFLHGRIELANGAAKLADFDAGLEDAVRAIIEGFRSNSPVASPLPDHVRLDKKP